MLTRERLASRGSRDIGDEENGVVDNPPINAGLGHDFYAQHTQVPRHRQLEVLDVEAIIRRSRG